MSKLLYILLPFLILGIGYFLTRPPTTVMTDVTASPKTISTALELKGNYVPYSNDSFSRSASTRRVLFFYATWCPTCVPADSDFANNATMLPADVTLIRVNYNDSDTDADEKALATKYGITYQHTYVQIDAQGNEVAKWNGGATKELLDKIK